MSKQLVVATRNSHKIDEIRAMLPEFQVHDLSVISDPPEVEETGSTFLENATLKALAISKLTESYVLSDDSGLEVDSLNGEPGVYSSRYAGEDGNDALNNAKLMRELAEKEKPEERAARFRCVLVLAKDGEVITHTNGAVEGRILSQMQGEGGFGYDPLFAPDGYEDSFAQLGDSLKNTMSHRSRALEKLKTQLSEIF